MSAPARTPARRRPRPALAVVAAVAVLLSLQVVAGATTAHAATTLPSGFVETRLPYELTFPSSMAVAPDGRVFVGDRQGALRVFKDDVLLPTPAVQLDVSVSGERGLLGIAFDPQFAANGHLYLYYTARLPSIHNRVSRFTVSGDVVVAGSELVLLDLDDLVSDQHNAGAMHFGPDGKLYITTGDNYSSANAQTLSNLLGKVLRINADGSIPTDNPFYGSATGRNRAIWALGLRNPYTFDIEAGSGRMLVNDVGHVTWEEINEGVVGSNYGWPATEGPTDDPRFRSPVHAYPHGSGSTETGCAITGGSFYDPATPQFPSSYLGTYFFLDYCDSWIKTFDPATGDVALFASNIPVWWMVYLATAPDGSLYFMTSADPNGKGALFKITYADTLAPQIGTQPLDAEVTTGQSATFSLSAYGEQPLAYQWQVDGASIPGATSPSYTTPPTSLADDGRTYRAVVSNGEGTTTSRTATLRVTADRPPDAVVVSPAEGATYRAGDVVHFSGAATDPEDGDLPASAYAWRVDLHHNTHVHPGVFTLDAATSGSFTVPRSGETSTNVFYRINLTATDSAGGAGTAARDVRPVLSSLTLRSQPAGVPLTLDGQGVTPPYTEAGVVGITRTLGAPASHTVNGAIYEFAGWSDGGAATHEISTPETATTYTATYLVAATGSISTSPSVLYVGPSATVGSTSVSWTSTSPSVEVRVGSPSGSLFARSGAGTHAQATGAWVSDGMTFYLQDVSGGRPLNAAGTLGTVSVKVSRTWGELALQPPVITQNDGTGNAVTTVHWATSKPRVEVRLHSPTGKRFAASGPGTFAAATGKWVRNGTVFYLVELGPTGSTPLSTIATATARVRSGSISASPNPIVTSGTSGVTTLTWKTAGVSTVEVRIGSPSGQRFAQSGAGTRSATTGSWVKDGMVFYLQDVTGGLPLTGEHTLGTVTVGVIPAAAARSRA